jgi:hypothetical protein
MKTALFLFVFVVALFVVDSSAHPSWAIVVDDKNQIFVSDLEKIWKIDAEGRVSIFSETHTHEMRLDENGNLLGEEIHYEPATQKFSSSLWRITPNGEFSYILERTETPPKGVSIWKNQAGAMFYFGLTEDKDQMFYLLKREANGNIKVLLGDREKAMREQPVYPI